MSADYLKKILEHKKKRLQDKKAFFSSLKEKLDQAQYTRYNLFKNCISKPDSVNLIAEIKKASPSKGMLRENFDLREIAKLYVDHKAAAISILTEEKYFLGKPVYVKQVADNFNVPLLTKDFIIDEGQIYEARFNGASAVLLIVAILTDEKLKNLIQVGYKLDVDCLVEVHDQEELQRASDAGAEIIGVNNRNLTTFEVSLKVCERLIPKIDKQKIIVAESGIQTHKDVQDIKALGAHAVLIGETFMKAKDMSSKLKEVMYGQS